MKVLVTDIYGSFAHFRVIYTNANALSYSFPPRTTIAGMIAGIIGKERDSYYDEFSQKNIRISVRGIKRIKKQVFVVNYYKTEKEKIRALLDRKFETYPTKLELVLPDGDDILGYRVYIGEGENRELYEEIKRAFEEKRMKYSLSLGLSEFLGWYEYKGEYEAIEDKTKTVHSVIPEGLFDKLDIKGFAGDIYLEEIPLEFLKNGNMRFLKSKGKFLYMNGNGAFKFVEDVEAFKVGDEFIIWMEDYAG